MALPIPNNTTCDIYNAGAGPPNNQPRLSNVPCYLKSCFEAGMEHGEARPQGLMYTHLLLVDQSVDIRDGFANANPASGDLIYIPQGQGINTTYWLVIFVERVNPGMATDHKRVFLQRQPGSGLPWTTQTML